MKKLLFVIASLTSLVIGTDLYAAPVQVALIPPVQAVRPAADIKGLRLNIIYGVNANVTGIDLGLGNRTTGNFVGFQLGAVNFTDQNSQGVVWGLYNQTRGDFHGWQSGVVNVTNGAVHGAQTGLWNQAGELSGFQLGIYNAAGIVSGLQIGLLNFNSKGRPYKFLPIVNWAF